MAKTEKEKATPTALTVKTAEQMPSFMANKVGAGLEGIGAGDVETPRFQILDAISSQVTEGLGQPGQFWHTILEEAISGPIRAVPLFVTKSYMLWRPRTDGGGILARADDGVNWSPGKGVFEVFIDKQKKQKRIWKMAPTVAESKLAEWGTYDDEDEKSQPAATAMYNVAFCFPDLSGWSPSVLTFQRGRIKVGRNFLGKLKLSTAPIFGRYFTITAFDDENARGENYKNYRLEASGLVQNEEEFKGYEALHDMFSKLGLKVKVDDGLQDESGGGSAASAGDSSASEADVEARGSRKY